LLLLLFFPQQTHYVAGLGDLGEIKLGLDLSCGSPLPRRSTGLGSNILFDQFCFVNFKRAGMGLLCSYTHFR
jgi:hypothetical protein